MVYGTRVQKTSRTLYTWNKISQSLFSEKTIVIFFTMPENCGVLRGRVGIIGGLLDYCATPLI
jgi:hypothetical protein